MVLNYLHVEIIEGNNNKYLFNIMNHFSKFLILYLIPNKEAETIFRKLKLCFDDYEYREHVGCHNVMEFINKTIINCLNIKI